MHELLLLTFYLVALLAGSVYFHIRFPCRKASCLAGFVASWVAVIVICATEPGNWNPMTYLAAFIYVGLGLWVVSFALSGLIGAAIQFRKEK
jgi:hypothetical protein